MKLLIPKFSTIEIIDSEEIVCIHADDNYSKVSLVNDTEISNNKSLVQYTEELTDQGFFQCLISQFLNLHKFKKYFGNGQAEMYNGEVVPVTRSRKEAFLSFLRSSAHYLTIPEFQNDGPFT